MTKLTIYISLFLLISSVSVVNAQFPVHELPGDPAFTPSRQPVKFTVYPNPCSGWLNVLLPPQRGKILITINDMNGRVIVKKYVSLCDRSNTVNITLANNKTGVYLLKVMNGKEITTSQIVLVNGS